MSEPDWDRFENFGRREFVCSCGCDRADVDPNLVEALQWLRNHVGAPLVISSGYRCPEYNAEVSTTGRDGPHVRGLAADVLCHGATAHKLLALANAAGFKGIGVAQKGDLGSRFLHLDQCTEDDGFPRPTVWSY